MKSLAALFLTFVMIFSFAGCGTKDPHEGEERFSGIVMNDIGDAVIVRTYDLYQEQEGAAFVRVSKHTRDQGDTEEYWQGAEIMVYYDGTVKEAQPLSVDNVYAIEFLEQ